MEPRVSAGGAPTPEFHNDMEPGVEAGELELVCRVSECRPEPVGVCQAEPEDASADPAVNGLVAAYESSKRSAQSSSSGGATHSGDERHAGPPVKTNDLKGLEIEVFGASARVGKEQVDLRAGLGRLDLKGGSVDGWHASGAMEVLTGRFNAGIHNDDGTTGANLGLGGTLIGGEVTLGYGRWSVTAGAALSAGVAFSSGEADVDGDGAVERCAKGSAKVVTLGVCTEFR